MASLFEKLPTILVLAVLVAIFLSLRRHAKSPRIHMWIVAWGLIFLHFFVRIFESSGGRLGSLAYAVDLGALQVAGIVFTVSLTVMATSREGAGFCFHCWFLLSCSTPLH